MNKKFNWMNISNELIKQNKKGNASLSLLFYFVQIIGFVPQVLSLVWVRIIMIKWHKDNEHRKTE
jgi:hypothetical protein